jgi:hypothetical protein
MKQIAKIGWLLLMGWILLPMTVYAETKPAYAGTTADRATRIDDMTALFVQSGSNYIRIEPEHLPATVTYLPDSAFGPLPTAMVTGDTIPATVIFQYASCQMGWQWTIEQAENEKIIEIKAHENASLLVEPHVCQTTYGDTIAAVCGGLEWYGVWCDTTGEYTVTLVNAEGCDSIHTLHLTVYKPEDTDTTAEVWDSLVWYGKTYTEDGDYNLELKDEHGCDYIHTLHLTVHTTIYDTIALSDCDSIIYEEQKYTASGEYQDTVIAEDGNRTIQVLVLTIGQTSYNELTIAQYDSYTSPSGKIYTESGDYTDTLTNLSECDSIITIHLTIYETNYNSIEPMTGCDSIVYEGKTFTQSGEYIDTIIAVDSSRTIRTLTLTIGYTTYYKQIVTKNGSYTSPSGKIYTESGDYLDTIPNVAGCDSIITTHLTISEVSYDTVYFCRGYNREHEEQISETLIRRYMPYTYEAPTMTDYSEGVIIEINGGQALVDFHRAENNLRAHYTGGLTPVESIVWSIRYDGQSAYTPIVVEETQPQWIGMGVMAIQIMFRCGEVYNNAFPMGVEKVVETMDQPIKRIENGQVVIIRGNAVFTPLGVRVK